MTEQPGPGEPAIRAELPDGRAVLLWFQHKVSTTWVGTPHRHRPAKFGPREGTACVAAVEYPPEAKQENVTALAVSRVHPGDVYSRAIGRRRSAVLAMEALGLEKFDRWHVWQEILRRGW